MKKLVSIFVVVLFVGAIIAQQGPKKAESKSCEKAKTECTKAKADCKKEDKACCAKVKAECKKDSTQTAKK